jgi:hypothetical protein
MQGKEIIAMATTFNLIRTAQKLAVDTRDTNTAIQAHMDVIAESTKLSVKVISESVLSLLANVAVKAEQGQKIDLMHQNSVAAFLAGVEAIALALPSSTDEQKKQNTLRALAVAGLGEDGTVNDATFPIVNLGARKPELHAKWGDKLKQYIASGEGAQLAQAVRQLQMNVDRAMRSSTQPRATAPAGPSMQGHPPSGG